MTAKEKANVLVEKFYQKAPEVMGTGRAQEFGKDMAIMVVTEMLDDLPRTLLPDRYSYWEKVKEELKNY